MEENADVMYEHCGCYVRKKQLYGRYPAGPTKMDADVTDKLLFVYTVVGCKACLEQMYRADGIAEMTSRGVFQMTN